MTGKIVKFSILTPCFCAGANQSKAEIRAPSIRGELRWWFRVLGGTDSQENEVFGSIHDSTYKTSALTVRVESESRTPNDTTKLPIKPKSPMYYLFHFAKASRGIQAYNTTAFIAPGTEFSVNFILRRKLSADASRFLDKAINAFSLIGAMGSRSTRGLGSIQAVDSTMDMEQFLQWAKNLTNIKIFQAGTSEGPVLSDSWQNSLHLLESFLRTMRKKHSAGKNGTKPSPLGRAKPRQRSGILLRPVKVKEGFLSMVLYVPGILDDENNSRIELAGTTFQHPFDSQSPETYSLLS